MHATLQNYYLTTKFHRLYCKKFSLKRPADEMFNICLICRSDCTDGESLSNGNAYHLACYSKLVDEVDSTKFEKRKSEMDRGRLKQENKRVNSLLHKLFKVFSVEKIDSVNIEKELKLINSVIDKLEVELQGKESILSSLYDFWLTYPPDWEIRSRAARDSSYGCENCGNTRHILHIHHKIPISRGGSHKIKNLVVLCEVCHSRRHGGKEFQYSEKDEVGAYGRRINFIKNAINNGSIIHFRYSKYDGSKSVRSISPSEFKRVGETLCVAGYCYLRNEDRTFAIKRMKGVRVVTSPGKCHDL